MSENTEFDQNRSEFTSMVKDGMIVPITHKGEDGKPKTEYIINPDSAYWKTHNINSWRFGLAAEAVEYLDALADDAEYNMSEPMAKTIKGQIQRLVNDVLKRSIDAKSSEAMKDQKSGGTSMMDKYLKRSSERIIDLKGEMKKAGMMGIFGNKEAERADD